MRQKHQLLKQYQEQPHYKHNTATISARLSTSANNTSTTSIIRTPSATAPRWCG